MKKVINKIRVAVNNVDFNRFRFWLQVFFFVLLVYGGYMMINISSNLPTFACGYDRDGRGGLCYLMPLQHQLAWPWAKLFSVAGWTVLTGFAVFALWFFALNKGWCGFACPLGTIQDWITSLRKAIGVRYSRYTKDQFRSLTKIKYVILALMIIIPLGIGGGFFPDGLKSPFCMICPGRMVIPMFTGDFSQVNVDFSTKSSMIITALGMGILGLFVIGSFVKKRFFCFFCPMSALHYILSKPALLRLKKDGTKCTRCGDCYRVCDMEIREIADDIKTPQIMTDDCTLCLKCVAACPENGCLKANFAGITIFESTEEGFIARANKELKDTTTPTPPPKEGSQKGGKDE